MSCGQGLPDETGRDMRRVPDEISLPGIVRGAELLSSGHLLDGILVLPGSGSLGSLPTFARGSCPQSISSITGGNSESAIVLQHSNHQEANIDVWKIIGRSRRTNLPLSCR